MAVANIRALTTKNRTSGKRGVFYLSSPADARVVMVPDDNNFYIYYSPSIGSPWTLVQTVAHDLTTTDSFVFAANVDASNHLHVAWRTHNLNVKYAYFTFTGTTYNAPTLRTLNSGTGDAPDSIDLDCPGSAGKDKYAVVTAHYGASGSLTTFIRCFVVDNPGAAVYTYTSANVTTRTSGTIDHQMPDITVQCDKTTDPTTGSQFVFALVHTQSAGTTDQGDIARTFKFDTASHAITELATKTIPSAGHAYGRRKYYMSNKEASTTYYVACNGVPSFTAAFSFSVHTTTGAITMIAPYATSTANEQGTWRMGTTRVPFGWAMSADRLISIGGTVFTAYTSGFPVFNADGTISFYDGHNAWDAQPAPGYHLTGVVGGSARYQHPNITFLRFYNASTGSNFRVDVCRLAAPLAPTNKKPVGGTVIPTSFPTVEARYNLVDIGAKVRYKMGWQFSQDAGFSTFTEVVQDDTFYGRPYNTAQADVRTSAIFTGTRLATGVWYIRPFTVDEVGNRSPNGTSVSVTILHAPSASDLQPTNDDILVYLAGGNIFSWTFSDPSPGDVQTAYQIVVKRASDDASVADSGIVASTSPAGSVVIPSAQKGVELYWVLTVFDTDGTPSTASPQQLFFVSDPPAPTITSPTNGSSITTGQPVINWTSGVAGSKTQTSFRVVITQNVNTIWDSQEVYGTGSSIQVPAGLLHNLNSYTLRITITDNLGQQGTVIGGFKTSYVVPAGVGNLDVYSYEFDRKGFMHIGWDSSSIDADFTSWYLYRQGVGDALPTLLASFRDVRPTYGFRDYSAKANTTYSYWITQVVNRSGDLVESGITRKVTVVTPGTQYWLLDSLNIISPVPLLNVTGDSWTDEHEENVTNLIGRGRHVDIGERWGVDGSLDIRYRDRYMGYDKGNNWCPNANMQYSADGQTPDGWSSIGSLSGNPYSSYYDTYYEPAPHGKANVWAFSIDSLTSSAGHYVSIITPTTYVADTDMAVNSKVCAAIYLATPPSYTPGITTAFAYIFYDVTGAIISSGTLFNTLFDTYEPPGADASNFGNWKRYGTATSIPTGTVGMKFAWYIFSNVTGPLTFYAAAASINGGLTPNRYFDGDCLGCTYTTAPGSASYSSGLYSARDQRHDVEEMKNLDRPVYLRNPFGDIYLASVGDQANTRIAGTGNRDIEDSSMPYREVVF